MNILVKMASEDEVAELTKAFKRIDTDNSGFIGIQELMKVINKQHLNMTEEDAQSMIKESDYSGTGQINYSEFIAATIDVKKFLSDTKLRSVFSLFDTDHSGKITIENLHDAFQKLGQEVPIKDLKSLMDKHDTKHDGCISFDEFKEMVLGSDGLAT